MHPFSRYAGAKISLVVLAAGLLLTGIVMVYLSIQGDREARVEFEMCVERLTLQIHRDMLSLVQTLQAMQKLVEGGASVDTGHMTRLAEMGREPRAALPGVRWFAFFQGQDSAGDIRVDALQVFSVASSSVNAPTPGSLSGSNPEAGGLRRALLRAGKTGTAAFHTQVTANGAVETFYLVPITRPGKRRDQGPFHMLVAELDVHQLLQRDLNDFIEWSHGMPIEKYSIRLTTAKQEALQGADSVHLLELHRPGRPPAAAPGNALSAGEKPWFERESELDLGDTRLRLYAAVPRTAIRVPQDAIFWWALAAGVIASILLMAITGRISWARVQAENISRRLDSQARSSEARFRKLVESTRDWMWETDAGGAITYTSGSVKVQLGYTPTEIVGKRGSEFGFHLELESAARAQTRVEILARHSSGREIWLQCSCSRYQDDDGKLAGYRGVCSDITEQKRGADQQKVYEQELNRMDKMGTLEHVMSMVAHELNQPLAAVASYCGASIRMLRENPSSLHEVIAALTAASSQAQVASATVRSIRQYITRREPNVASHPVAEMIRNAVSLSAFRLDRARIAVETRIEERLPAVLADDILIVQVLLNLLHNAIDAVELVSSPSIVITASRGGDSRVCIAVDDNGQGMSDEQLGRCLDPYFTTKTNGLGLGLSISQAIVESHGGTLKLSRNAHGSCSAAFSLEADPGRGNTGG